MSIRSAFGQRKRTRVLFRRAMHTMQSRSTHAQPPSARLEQLLDSDHRIEEMSDSENQSDKSSDDVHRAEEPSQNTQNHRFNIPALFSALPRIVDKLKTESSEAQAETIKECLPFLTGIEEGSNTERNAYGIARLNREAHARFLRMNLGKFPAPFVAMDASRPWLFYWALMGLSVLGKDVSEYRER